jgi:hypothetical protein
MDIKEIKRLAQEHTAAELEHQAQAIEETGEAPKGSSKDAEGALSDVLQALEVRKLLDQGLPLGDAVRQFSSRVRQSIS